MVTFFFVSLQLGSRGLKSVLYTLNVCLFFHHTFTQFFVCSKYTFWFQHFSAIVAIVTLCRSAFLHTGHDKPVSSLATPGSFYFLRYHLTGVFWPALAAYCTHTVLFMIIIKMTLLLMTQWLEVKQCWRTMFVPILKIHSSIPCQLLTALKKKNTEKLMYMFHTN